MKTLIKIIIVLFFAILAAAYIFIPVAYCINKTNKKTNTMKTIDKAIYILENTYDGRGLTQKDLKIVESAVNGYLNDSGLKYFNLIHKMVENDTYTLMHH